MLSSIPASFSPLAASMKIAFSLQFHWTFSLYFLNKSQHWAFCIVCIYKLHSLQILKSGQHFYKIHLHEINEKKEEKSSCSSIFLLVCDIFKCFVYDDVVPLQDLLFLLLEMMMKVGVRFYLLETNFVDSLRGILSGLTILL